MGQPLDHKDKLDFLHKIAKLGIQHFDGGGLVGGLGSALGITSNFNASGPSSGQIANSYTNTQNALTNAGGLSNATLNPAVNAIGNQNALAAQLMAMTQGQGPNPALAQLNQATGANTANQAALMAGQRGAGQNVGLLARQAAQQGAANQQNAVGTAAGLQAQQQIAAQNNLANLSASQIGQAGQATGLAVQGSNQQLQTLEGANSAANSTNAGTSQSNAGAVSGLVGGIGAAIGLAKGGAVPKKMAAGGISTGAINAPTSSGSWVGNFLSGNNSSPSSGGSPGGGTLATAVGNAVGKGALAIGNGIGSLFSSSAAPAQSQQSISDMNAQQMSGAGMNAPLTSQGAISNANADMMSGPSTASSQGSILEDNPDTGINPADTEATFQASANGGKIRKLASKGDVIKASGKEKAVKAGNSYANDKVPALLSEGEVVIDRNTLNDPGPVGQMARSIRSHIEARNKRK